LRTSNSSCFPGLRRTIVDGNDLVAGFEPCPLRGAARHHVADHRRERRLLPRESQRPQEIGVEVRCGNLRQVELAMPALPGLRPGFDGDAALAHRVL
jgi:hypothetical protein